jgi:hypothetical protein
MRIFPSAAVGSSVPRDKQNIVLSSFSKKTLKKIEKKYNPNRKLLLQQKISP